MVDDIVVVDTGSTDRTASIARRHGAAVHHMRWRGDFSAARNRALELARGQWILYIDADERVRPAGVKALRRQLRNPRLVALEVTFHPTAGSTPFRIYRLFRNDPRIRFEGVMHETMMRGVERVAREDGLRFGTSRLVMDHVGYDGDQRRKWRRNVTLLRKALAREPRSIWNRAHLASIYASLGRTREAERTWRDAIARVRASGTANLYDSVAHSGYAGWLVNNDRGAAATVIADGLRRFPANLELQWTKARWLMRKHRWTEATVILASLAAHHGGRKLDLVLPYPRAMFGHDAFAALGTCYFKRRRYSEAARWYARAHRDNPDNPEHAIKARLARRLANGSTITS